MIRLATWNWCQGGAVSTWQARRAEADLWFVQEARPISSTSDESVLQGIVPGNGWGSAVISRIGTIEPIEIRDYSGWVTGGVIEHSRGPLSVFSIHSPSPNNETPRESYVEESRRIVTAIRAAVPANALLIIGGDFNFQSLGERHIGEVKKTTSKERAVLAEWKADDLVPLWQAVNPGIPLQQTLRWTKNKATPYHVDGFLVPSRLVTNATCTIESGLPSDHDMVVATLDL